MKFRAGTDMQTVMAALPPAVTNSASYIDRLFSLSEQQLDEMMAVGESHSGQTLPDLTMWMQIVLRPGTDAAAFLDNLKHLDSVEVAEPAPLPAPPPAVTPDFTGNQGYLNAATNGIDARYAWTLSGGNGGGITIYDVEYSWNQTHEDLSRARGVRLLLNAGDTAVDPFNDNNHGTAVLGELIADNDAKGVTGIAWGSNIGLAPAKTARLGYNPANAIALAAAAGSARDVILIEQQTCVCNIACPRDETQQGYGPLEWSTPVFDAIQVAVAKGIVVVEAAGNGNVNLDQAGCENKFNRSVRDSGAIIVGAGGSPGSADRQRLWYSSYGNRVDVQGWGENVTTTGYGNSYKNPDNLADADFWYTQRFGGTSSASQIVAGAAALVQGIALQQQGTPLSPSRMRQLLVQTGSPQLGNTAEHIGPRPDLRQAMTITQFPADPVDLLRARGEGQD